MNIPYLFSSVVEIICPLCKKFTCHGRMAMYNHAKNYHSLDEIKRWIKKKKVDF